MDTVLLDNAICFRSWEQVENINSQRAIDVVDTLFKVINLPCRTEESSFSTGRNHRAAAMKPDPPVSSPTLISASRQLHDAVVKLQKVYKSYRTRRSLADCAVVIEELWWRAFDFASLKQSSVSFFNVHKPETAISRWARARTRAAKVGKGLSKNEKAQKLALQHWLEAIDPRHRYGHNLQLYYDDWFHSDSTQPFFYWLDIGDGKELNLEKCPRTRLQQQCVRYLGPVEREAYEVVVHGGKLVYKLSEAPVDTIEGCKWIFVLSASRNMYVGRKVKGTFHHSSFLSGGATTAAGRLVAENGILKAIWPHSGHYLPTKENFKEFIVFLEENNVDLSNVMMYSVGDDKHPSFRKPEDDPIVETTTHSAENQHRLTITDADATRLDDKAVLEDQEEEVPELFELGKSSPPLPCNWNTGTRPRISCVKDYPVDLQMAALEQVNLSPRGAAMSPAGNRVPIPSPRPGAGPMLSPRLALIGIPSPRTSSLM